MKLKLKITITQQKINYYLYFGVITIAIVVLILTTSFLYKNFYKTITQSEIILILRSQVASEMVNMEKFETIIEKLDKKTVLRELKITRNPFKKNTTDEQ